MGNPWTPGPWRADDSRRVIFGGDLAVALVRSDEDAALIAAAPEMAEALDAALVSMETMVKRHDPAWDGKAEPWSAIGKARALLARIRGEAA